MTLIWVPEIAKEKCEFLLEGESERGIKHRDRAGSIKMQEWRLLARKNVAKIKKYQTSRESIYLEELPQY